MLISTKELTIYTGSSALAEVLAAIDQQDFELDFQSVKRVDSTAIAIMLAARRHAKNPESIKLLNRPAQLEALIQAYGVQSLFN